MRPRLIALGVLLGALLVGAAPWACRTGPDGRPAVDWPALATELELAARDLEDAADLAGSEGLAADLDELAGYLHEAANAIALQGGAGKDPYLAIGAALDFAEGLADRLGDDQDAQNVRLAVFAARAILRRVEAYGAPPAWPPP